MIIKPYNIINMWDIKGYSRDERMLEMVALISEINRLKKKEYLRNIESLGILTININSMK